MTSYRMWANTDRTVFVRLWFDGGVQAEMEILHVHPELGLVPMIVLEEVEPKNDKAPLETTGP